MMSYRRGFTLPDYLSCYFRKLSVKYYGRSVTVSITDTAASIKWWRHGWHLGPGSKREEITHKLTGSSLCTRYVYRQATARYCYWRLCSIAVNNVKGLTDAGGVSTIEDTALDLVATTDAHHRPVRVHAQRPGKDYKLSLRAQDSAIQKPDQNRNNMSHSLQSALGTKPYIQL